MNRHIVAVQIGALWSGLALVASAAFAQLAPTGDVAPLDVKMSMKSASVVAGEPIIITYSITNTAQSPTVVMPRTSTDQTETQNTWVTFELLDENGHHPRTVSGERPRPPVDVSFGHHTIDLLAELWRSARWPEQETMARSMLLEMYQDGGSWLRPTIERLFVQREGEFTPLPNVNTYHPDG